MILASCAHAHPGPSINKILSLNHLQVRLRRRQGASTVGNRPEDLIGLAAQPNQLFGRS